MNMWMLSYVNFKKKFIIKEILFFFFKKRFIDFFFFGKLYVNILL